MFKIIRSWVSLLVFCVSIGAVVGVIGGTAIVVARIIEAAAR